MTRELVLISCRVTWLEGAHRPEIEHLIDAFGGDDV